MDQAMVEVVHGIGLFLASASDRGKYGLDYAWFDRTGPISTRETEREPEDPDR
jgi:hypothetical protein